MNAISYNCRGLVKARAVSRLTNLVRKEALKVLFLMETKSDRRKMEAMRLKLGFVGVFIVDYIGRSGGLSLMWDDGMKVTVKSYTDHHIDVTISLNDSDQEWRFTGVYGWPKGGGSINPLNSSRDLLRTLTRLGYVNVGKVLDFQTAIEGCEMRVMEAKGPRCTWDNGREGADFIQECIDLVFANDKCELDHVPVKVTFNSKEMEEKSRIPRPFRFEAMWVDEDTCAEVVRNAWINPGNSHVESNLVGKGGTQSDGEDGNERGSDWIKKRLRGERKGLMRKEEAMWLQRAKANEFKWGD
ncbi:hypothetical protein V2J09_004862 [Rumex salicifolius]